MDPILASIVEDDARQPVFAAPVLLTPLPPPPVSLAHSPHELQPLPNNFQPSDKSHNRPDAVKHSERATQEEPAPPRKTNTGGKLPAGEHEDPDGETFDSVISQTPVIIAEQQVPWGEGTITEARKIEITRT
jgi:hypothetical protein